MDISFSLSQDGDLFADDNLTSQDFLQEIQVDILLTTISCPIWSTVMLQIRKSELILYRTAIEHKTREKRTIKLHCIPFAAISEIVLNPDNTEISIETKTSNGYFTLRLGEKYIDIVEALQQRSAEQYRHIIWQYKTKAQDKKYGLLSPTDKDALCTKPTMIHRGNLLFRVYTSYGYIE